TSLMRSARTTPTGSRNSSAAPPLTPSALASSSRTKGAWSGPGRRGAVMAFSWRHGQTRAAPGESIEQRADRAFVGDAANGLAQQRRDGQLANAGALENTVGRQDGIGDDQLAQLRAAHACHRAAREHAMGHI